MFWIRIRTIRSGSEQSDPDPAKKRSENEQYFKRRVIISYDMTAYYINLCSLQQISGIKTLVLN